MFNCAHTIKTHIGYFVKQSRGAVQGRSPAGRQAAGGRAHPPHPQKFRIYLTAQKLEISGNLLNFNSGKFKDF